LVAFVSEEAHYSFLKSAVVIGIGSDNLVKIPTIADSGMMDTDALRRAIEKAMSNGQLPFFVGATTGTTVVGATTGTTVVGAFDSLQSVQAPVQRVSKEHGLWVHVDAAWEATY
jgi:glutamate/tyrosine decarboxylase-like PLP-dependent enzyme